MGIGEVVLDGGSLSSEMAEASLRDHFVGERQMVYTVGRNEGDSIRGCIVAYGLDEGLLKDISSAMEGRGEPLRVCMYALTDKGKEYFGLVSRSEEVS